MLGYWLPDGGRNRQDQSGRAVRRQCRLCDAQQQHVAERDEHEHLARSLGLAAGSAADDMRHEQQHLRLWRDDETRLPQRAGLYEHGPVQRRYLEQQQSEVQRDVRPDRARGVPPCGDDGGRQCEAAASVRGREGSERVAGELYRHAEKLRHEPVLCGIGQSDRVELEVDVQGHDRRGRHLQPRLVRGRCVEPRDKVNVVGCRLSLRGWPSPGPSPSQHKKSPGVSIMRFAMRPSLLRDVSGSAYLALLISIVIMGLTLTLAAKQLSTVMTRAKEADLLARGLEIQNALEAYAVSVQTARVTPNQTYPSTLEELTRLPKPFLRRVYTDPMTNGEWDYLRDERGHIRGVKSRSGKAPFKQR